MSDRELVLLGGAAVLAVALIWIVWRILFIRRAVTTQGTVTDMESHHDSESGTTYSPVVTFQTADGQSIQFSPNVSSSAPSHQIGETVPVKYLVNKPQDAKIGTPTSLWWAPALFAVAGVGLLVWGFFFLEDIEEQETTEANVPSLARQVPEGQTRLTVINQAEPRVLGANCASIRDIQQGNVREVQILLEGDVTLILKAQPYTGPKAYTVPIGGSVGGTVLDEATQPPSGAIVFQGNGQNGVVNVSAQPLSVSGNWDCTKVELERS
jgi:hypothetical protein